MRPSAEKALRSGRFAATHPTSRRDNAKFGWLGRKRFRAVVTPRTVNYELQVLHTFFRWAVGRNLAVVNPVSGVERFRISKRALPKFLSTERSRDCSRPATRTNAGCS